jgi:hypothetical protein
LKGSAGLIDCLVIWKGGIRGVFIQRRERVGGDISNISDTGTACGLDRIRARYQ